MAIPIAKSLGAIVYTNGSADNEERVLSLDVDRFIDYKKEDYADILSDVDCVLDTLGKRELAKELSVLKKGGSIVSLRAMPNGEFAKRSEMCAVSSLYSKWRAASLIKWLQKENRHTTSSLFTRTEKGFARFQRYSRKIRYMHRLTVCLHLMM